MRRKASQNSLLILHYYLKRIEDEVKTNNIPAHLRMNWDQTGSNLVAVSSWTMAEEGGKQVPVVGKEDKHCIVSCHSIWCSSPSPVNLLVVKLQGAIQKNNLPSQMECYS